MTFDPTKPVQLKGGGKAEIFERRIEDSPYSLIVVCETGRDLEALFQYNCCGERKPRGTTGWGGKTNLVNIPEPSPIPRGLRGFEEWHKELGRFGLGVETLDLFAAYLKDTEQTIAPLAATRMMEAVMRDENSQCAKWTEALTAYEGGE